MGCDIHVYVERRWLDRWVCVEARPEKASDRDYVLFANLAGVRGEGPDPRGLPIDMSESTAYWANKWKHDAHSHSWLPLKDAIAVWQAAKATWSPLDAIQTKHPEWAFFGVEPRPEIDPTDTIDNYRVVFWFDN